MVLRLIIQTALWLAGMAALLFVPAKMGWRLGLPSGDGRVRGSPSASGWPSMIPRLWRSVCPHWSSENRRPGTRSSWWPFFCSGAAGWWSWRSTPRAFGCPCLGAGRRRARHLPLGVRRRSGGSGEPLRGAGREDSEGARAQGRHHRSIPVCAPPHVRRCHSLLSRHSIAAGLLVWARPGASFDRRARRSRLAGRADAGGRAGGLHGLRCSRPPSSHPVDLVRDRNGPVRGSTTMSTFFAISAFLSAATGQIGGSPLKAPRRSSMTHQSGRPPYRSAGKRRSWRAASAPAHRRPEQRTAARPRPRRTP